MLRGHVDRITASFLTGWAIDTDQLNKRVEVCVFLDGRKVAQVLCDQLRQELCGKPGFGDGKHVFRFSPAPPLSSSMPTRVTVRHATTGRILGNGEAILNGDGNKLPPDFGAGLPPDSLRISAPATSRQMFMSLLLYDRRQGLYNLLRQMDFAASSIETLLTAIFGKATPPTIEALAIPDSTALRDMLNEVLLSEEFRRSILRLFLNAFPEKRRLLFIHIPKCAGSDLLILDPFVRLHRIDENVSGDVAPLLAFLRDLQRRHAIATTLYQRLSAMTAAGIVVKSADGYSLAGH